MSDKLTKHQLAEIERIMADPKTAARALPVEERERYELCQRSVVEARRTAERTAHEYWIF